MAFVSCSHWMHLLHFEQQSENSIMPYSNFGFLSLCCFSADLVENFDEASKNEANWHTWGSCAHETGLQWSQKPSPVFISLDISNTLAHKPETFFIFPWPPDIWVTLARAIKKQHHAGKRFSPFTTLSVMVRITMVIIFSLKPSLLFMKQNKGD